MQNGQAFVDVELERGARLHESKCALGIQGARLGDKPGVLLNFRLNKISGQAVDERVRFLLAGFCADRRFNLALCSRENSAADFEKALRLVPRDERRWHRLLTEADILVAQYRGAIRAVAYELLEHEALNALQIASIIRKSR